LHCRKAIAGEACALRADRRHQAFGLGQRESADAVDFPGKHDFTGLQVADHAQQPGAISASAGCLLAADARAARAPSTIPFWRVKSFFGTDAHVNPDHLHK
jgi:hypothetical protein